MCRPECVLNSECPLDRACVNQKCVNPCPASCGTFATCVVRNHSPICACRQSYTGDPFTRCFPIPRKTFLNTLKRLEISRDRILHFVAWSFRSVATRNVRSFAALSAISLWSKLRVSRGERWPILPMFIRVHRQST